MSRSGYYRDASHLVDWSNNLFFNEFKDRNFTFVIGDEYVKVHKMIVKVSSAKFGKLFKEWSNEGITSVNVGTQSITGEAVSAKSFRLFIQYCYTGSLNWKEVDDTDILDLLALCHEFGFPEFANVLADNVQRSSFLNAWNVWYFFEASNVYELQNLRNHSISFLSNAVSLWNVWAYYEASKTHEVQALRDSCIRFIDRHAVEALNEQRMYSLDPVSLKNIVGRDTLFAKEIDILKAVVAYLKVNKMPYDQKSKELIDVVRWSFITKREFTETLLPLGLVSEQFHADRNKEFEEIKQSKRQNPDRY